MMLALVGGFLGSGKTTAIVNACQQLIQQSVSVGVITNDQGDQQVDSEFVNSLSIPFGEVRQGCFCCRYDEFEAEIQSLSDKHHPDIIFAESVGSCMDLIATLAKPLNRALPDMKVVISVFADAELLISLVEERASFLEESVRYIYKKQLEEADFLILNKTDLVKPKELGKLDKILKSEYPHKTILHQSAFRDQDISFWLTSLEQFTQFPRRSSLDLDYDSYGEGESMLAWLDKRITINTEHNDCVFVARKIIGAIFNQIQASHLTIGHLKFFIETDHWQEKISFTATSTSADVDFPDRMANVVRLLINARVQTKPQLLEKLIDGVLKHAEGAHRCTIVTEKWSSFTPGYPRPTHRLE